MPNKRASYAIAEFKATKDGPKGEFTALVSVFGNVDHQGDRVMPGAFKNSLAGYEKSGDPIPVIWSHDWKDPFANIGKVTHAVETEKGLQITAQLDIEDNPIAAQTFKLLSERRVKEFSFGYGINKERIAEDKANELLDLDLFEVGPTFKGANPATELLGVKSYAETVADALGELGLDVDALRGIKSEGPAPLVIPAGDLTDADAFTLAPTTTGTSLTGVVDFLKVDVDSLSATTSVGIKAGARLSAETRAEMQSIHDGMNELTSRMRALMGAATEDAPKSLDTDHMPPATSVSEPEQQSDGPMPPAGPDDELLALTLRIEEMRIA